MSYNLLKHNYYNSTTYLNKNFDDNSLYIITIILLSIGSIILTFLLCICLYKSIGNCCICIFTIDENPCCIWFYGCLKNYKNRIFYIHKFIVKPPIEKIQTIQEIVIINNQI